AAIDDVKLGNITSMLTKIKPAVEMVDYTGEKNSENPEFVHEVCENNVKNTINQIQERSPILKEMQDNGEIKILGAIYDMDTGKVSFLED
ncbi:MAG: carbonic anhydrase, partial [Bacteroidota bacterium]